MTKLIVGIIVIYHTILRIVGKFLGMLCAGLFVGFTEGVKAVSDMHKYAKYHAAQEAIKAKRRKENGTKGD
jgi:hypothetical protein